MQGFAADMPRPLPTLPAEPWHYTGCPHCGTYANNQISPLPVDIAPAVNPDALDWNDYYWGYIGYDGEREQRRTIARPLPPSITDRIPLELYAHVLSFLRWDTQDLYNCALVCRAWHHYSQLLLKLRVVIRDRAAYDAIIHTFLKSEQYLARTRMLVVEQRGLFYPAPRMQYSSLPLVLGKSMCGVRCLQWAGSIRPPYHSSFIHSFSCFSSVIHLTLSAFTLLSFTDLRRMICGLTSLRELDLEDGKVVSIVGATNLPPVFPPVTAPRLRRVNLDSLEDSLVSKLAQWMSSTEICCGCTNTLSLTVAQEDPACGELLRKLGPSMDYLQYRLEYDESCMYHW